MNIDTEQILFQKPSEQISPRFFLRRIGVPPSMNEALESLHQKNAGAARGIQDSQIPLVARPRQNPVEDEINDMRGRVVDASSISFRVHEFFVNATNQLKRDGVKRVFR